MEDLLVRNHNSSDNSDQDKENKQLIIWVKRVVGFYIGVVLIGIVLALIAWKLFLVNDLSQTPSANPLTLQDFKTRYTDSSSIVAIDIRTSAQYNRNHLSRAINSPVENIDYLVRNVSAREILIYGDEKTSGQIATVADTMARQNPNITVYYLKDGTFNDWLDAGYPTALQEIKYTEYQKYLEDKNKGVNLPHQ